MTDDEFGAPEEVPVDMNRQINHTISSLTNALGQAHWKVGQHAAEVDHWKQYAAEKEAEVEALNLALKAEMEHGDKLEGLLERQTGVSLIQADDHQLVDAFQAMAAGQPGLSKTAGAT